MERYLKFILERPKRVIAGIALMTLILGSGLFKVEFESSLDSIMPKKDPEYILNEEIKKIYGNNGKFIIMCVSADDMMSPSILERVNALHEDIEEFENYDESREEKRSALLDGIIEKGDIAVDDLLAIVRDDHPFHRYIKLSAAKLFPDENILSKKMLKALKKKLLVTQSIKKDELVDLIVSPYTLKNLIGKDDTLITNDLIEKDDAGKRITPKTPEEIEAFRKRLYNNPAFEGGIYVTDKKTGKITDFGIMIRLADSFVYDPVVNEFHDMSKGYNGNMDVILQGIPVVYHEINQYMRTDLKRFLPLTILVVVLIFYLNFRSIRGVVLPFITLILADIWIVGLMGHLGFKLTIVGIALPPLMIAVGSSYAIHILNQYYSDLHDIRRLGKFMGLKIAMSHITLTVTLAGLTTFIGFFMLITNEVSSIMEWGVFSAIGVLFAVFVAISLIPAVFMILPLEKEPKKGHGLMDKISNFKIVEHVVEFMAKLAIDHSRAVIVVLSAILVFSFIGMTKIIVETSVHAYFKEGDYILTSSKLIGEKFGGSYGLNILIDSGEENGVKDPEFLKFIDEFRAWLIAEENIDLNIGRTDAITDFIKTMHLAMYNNDSKYYKIPDDRKDIESYISIYGGRDDNDDGLVDDFEPYVDRKFRTANIFTRIWEKQGMLIGSGIMDHLIGRINTYLDKNLPKKYTYKTSGEPKIIVQLSKYVVKGQIMSLMFSLVIVSLMVFLLFRNWRAGLVSLIPISGAVLFNFGLMGWLGLRLDLATAITASITIGIGIDDTIHFLNTYRHFKGKNLSRRDTIHSTLKISGKAIIYTSLALIFGFLVLVVSNFNPIMYFGLLVAGTMIATTVGALMLLPAVINAFNIDLSSAGSDTGLWKYLDLGKYFDLDK
jgi:hypothetical protein